MNFFTVGLTTKQYAQFDRWASALESGEFEQGEGRLVKVESDSGQATYCCLGVQCELMTRGDNPGMVRRTFDYWEMAFSMVGGTGAFTAMPPEHAISFCTDPWAAKTDEIFGAYFAEVWSSKTVYVLMKRDEFSCLDEESTVHLGGDLYAVSVIELNDTARKSFTAIAALLRRTYVLAE